MPSPSEVPLASSDPQQEIETILARMTLEEKIGQLFLVFFHGPALSPALSEMIVDYHIGGIVLFSIAGNIENPAQVAQMINHAQAEAVAHGAGIPLFVSVDQEGGPVVRLTDGVTHFPSQMAVGATASEELARRMAQVTAQELAALGINMNLAPVLDVNNNANNPVIGLRSFGSSPELVTRLGVAMLDAYREAGVIATVKHFPGHGDTTVDSHFGLPIIPHARERLDMVELAPFRAAVQQGAPAVMTAHVLFPAIDPDPDRPATLSPLVLQGLLRQEMGFEGVIITDSLGMGALKQLVGTVEAAQLALRAGADIVAFGADIGATVDEQKAAYQRILSLVQAGEISEEAIDASVRRILRLKAEYHLLEWAPVSVDAIPARVGTEEHRAVAQQIAEQSITLVKDDAALLPLAEDERVLVVWPSVAGDLGGRLSACRQDLILRPVSLDPTPAEVEQILLDAQAVSKIVIGTINARRYPAQVRLVEALQDRPLIVAALSQPYDLLAFPQISTYLATYGVAPVSLQALAQLLCGKISPDGALPVELPDLYP
jgi:beta-N-acetylhexosaminidase